MTSANIVGYSTCDAPNQNAYKALTVSFENVGETKQIAIKDLVKVGIPKGGASADVTASDQIWRWDTTAGDWSKYYYRKLGTREAVGWCKNGETTVTPDVIPAGEGFFFFRGMGGTTDTITFTYEEKKAE